MHTGYISLHRKLLQWEWYSDLPVRCLFIHLLLKVNHKDKNYKGVLIKRGQTIIGRDDLAKEVGLSVQQIRTAIKKLKSTREITIETTSGYHHIELVNYGLYQDTKSKSNQPINQQSNQRVTSNQPAINQQSTTNNNVNNVNNDNNIITVQKKPKVSKSKYNDFQFQIAEQLGTHIKNIKNINLTVGNIKKWASDIRLLQEQDLKPRQNSQQDIIKAMQSILDNTGNEYFPIVESGSSFRSKFSKIENYKKNNNKSRLGF